ncbi:MAG: hypothetical protein AABX37_03030 [Nanoarchaeota archaeon]|mgnify:CR=1 FL=1
MKFIDAKTIQLDRELSDLDVFVLDFVKILEKHIHYVLISGYVAILFGRSRTTEDVDMFIEKLSVPKAVDLYNDLLAHDFWALNASSGEDFYEALTKEKIAVRFARTSQGVPNVELKIVKDVLDAVALQDRIKVLITGGYFFVSDIAMQIAYKKFVLMSEKDLADAQYLQDIFSISEENINKCRRILQDYGRC